MGGQHGSPGSCWTSCQTLPFQEQWYGEWKWRSFQDDVFRKIRKELAKGPEPSTPK
jgi:hypothetical protein